jgi:2-amino-4-hydroxy-6-hydroxymethyldihydropteridine diphosphokinase
MDRKISAFLGLGGNLGDPLAAFRRTRQRLNEHPAIEDCRSSPLYQTPPIGGPPGQADYLNAVLMLKTSLDAFELLSLCLSLEEAEGRERKERWGARTLDIDLLLFEEQQINHKNLEIPHPRLMDRQFVLLPLVALAPELEHPVSGLSMQSQLDRLPIIETIKIVKSDW